MPMASPQRRRHEAPRAPRPGKAERKRQLLGHARQLFATLGYHATNVEKIAAAAGVTEAVLYRHFDGKKALFAELLHQVRAATLDRWAAETAALADPQAKLHAITEMYLGAAKEHAVELQILHRALVETDEEEIVTLLRGFYLDGEALLARVIAEGQQSGVFRRSLDARVGAWELIRTALGYTLTLPLGIPLYAEADYLPRAIDCLLHCLLKTDV
jgi:AcrR family transcriptional regulator